MCLSASSVREYNLDLIRLRAILALDQGDGPCDRRPSRPPEWIRPTTPPLAMDDYPSPAPLGTRRAAAGVQPLATTRKPSFKEGRYSMRSHHWISAWVSKGIRLALGLAFAGALLAFVDGTSSRVAAQTEAKIESTIFSYDGHDFVRTQTTLVTEKGESAVNTKLEHDSPAYKALIRKQSYTGDVTVFGRKYHANYAPLIGADGKLTGALFVAVTM